MNIFLKNTFLIVLIYALIFYALPTVLYVNFPLIFEREFRPNIDIYVVTFLILIVLFSYFSSFLSFYRLKKLFIFAVNDSNQLNSYTFQLIKTSIFFAIGILFFFLIGFSYRQTGTGVSSYGVLGYISLFALAYLKTEVIFDLVSYLNGYRLPTAKKILKLLGNFFPLLMLVSGAFAIPFVLVSFLIYWPIGNLSKFFQVNLIKGFLIFFPLFLILFVLLIIAGFANKYGFEFLMNALQDNAIQNYIIEYLIWRISIYYVSIQSVIDNLQLGIFDTLYSFQTSLNLSFDRLGTLFGLSVHQNEIRTLERLNFLYLFPQNDNYNSGTSPGLVAGLLLSGSAIFAILYVIFSSIIISLLTATLKNQLSLISSFILMIYFMFLFDNPLKFFVFPENEVTQLIIFLFFYFFYVNISRVNE